MNISICITTKNEEGSVKRLIDSLLAQTIKANEIIIADGNSTDGTREIIKKYPKIKLFITKKRGIAAGRNLAIEHAKNNIIVMTDAGCVAKKDWLEKITKPFVKNKNLLVAGYYEMPYITPLQQVMSIYHGIPPERFDKNKFLPSARSVAFNKSLWKRVGKFNEHLEKAGEDTEFFYKCVKTGVKIVRVGEARVVWQEVASMTLSESVKKFYSYAKGDAKIGIWWHPNKQLASHNIKISLIFIRYLIGLLFLIFCIYFHWQLGYLYLLVFIGIYLFYPIYKWFDVVKSVEGKLWLPIVQIISDFSIMIGFIHGLL